MRCAGLTEIVCCQLSKLGNPTVACIIHLFKASAPALQQRLQPSFTLQLHRSDLRKEQEDNDICITENNPMAIQLHHAKVGNGRDLCVISRGLLDPESTRQWIE